LSSPVGRDRAIGANVPPIAGTTLRPNVGSPALIGQLLLTGVWHCVVSRFLPADAAVVDTGRGRGKTARALLHHPWIKR
jgi:hypothetical protein